MLLFLFGSKEGLVRALLARARQDELELLRCLEVPGSGGNADALRVVVSEIWRWLAVERHRPLLTLWAEAYARSLVDPDGPWVDFGRSTVADWLRVLRSVQGADERDTPAGESRRTLALAVLRGALLDLLATGDVERTTAAVEQYLDALDGDRTGQHRR